MTSPAVASGQIRAADGRKDPFSRTIDYLRILVTDRCNEKCLYCMPKGYRGWARHGEHMTADEIVCTVEAAAGMGFRKFRITGGEPLLRKDILEICRRIREVRGVETLDLSSNATLLAPIARELRLAGVRSVNISLAALDPAVYERITGGRLQPVLEGIEAARTSGFEAIKLNCVLLRGINESEFLPIIRFAADAGTPLRFIELMPLTRTGDCSGEHFLSVEEMNLIGNRFLALRGVGPEFEAGSDSFYAWMLPDGALRVKCPAFRGRGSPRTTTIDGGQFDLTGAV